MRARGLLVNRATNLKLFPHTPEQRAAMRAEMGNCHAGRDGECNDRRCPQLKEGEPEKSGRHCPLDPTIDDPDYYEP